MNRVIADRERFMRRLTKSLSGNHEIDRLLKEKNRLAGIMNEMAEKADSRWPRKPIRSCPGIAVQMLQ